MDYLTAQLPFISSPNATEQSIKEAAKLWIEIANIFPKDDPNSNQSMPWTLGVQSLKACDNIMNTPQGGEMADEFIDLYVYRIVHLLLTQQPSKLGHGEVNYIETSVRTALAIFCKLKPESMVKNIKIIAVIFGRERGLYYYTGNKVQFTTYPGHALFRGQMIKKFAENKGFEMLFEHCFTPHHYFGADVMYNLAAAVTEAHLKRTVSDALATQIGSQFRETLLKTSDDAMKRDDTQLLNKFVEEIQRLTPSDDEFYAFWLKNTEKILSSDNIVMRLFGWDQISEIVQNAEYTAPSAARYIVSDCGNPQCNGIYEYKQQHKDKDGTYSNIYTKVDAPHFSLIRCKMKEDCKKWFISQIDTRNPGTNDDKDLYQQQFAHPRDQRYLECKPPVRQKEWTTSNPAKGQKHVGVSPGPNLKPDGLLLDRGQNEEDFLISKVPTWAREVNLLESVYATGVRNEIVSRSKNIIAFLAVHDQLLESDLQIIWKCGMTNPDIVICDSVFKLLAELTHQFSPSLFNSLMEICQNALQQGELLKISTYLEKFVTTGMSTLRNVRNLPDEYVKSFISLVWAVNTHPGFDTLKSKKHLEDLLSTSLSLPDGESIALGHLQECAVSLQDVTSSHKDTSRVVTTMLFLLEKHIKADSIRILHTEGFADTVLNELQRFVTSEEVHRGTTSAYSTALKARLDVLSLFYRASYDVKMPIESVETLWNLLTDDTSSSNANDLIENKEDTKESSSDVSKRQLFAFLESGVAKKQTTTFTDVVAEYVFTHYICSTSVQWTSSAFGCFHSYFSKFNLHNSVDQVLGVANDGWSDNSHVSTVTTIGSVSLDQYTANKKTRQQQQEVSASPRSKEKEESCAKSLQTLWQIVLNSADSSVTESAMDLLLLSYDDWHGVDNIGINDLLEIAFTHLNNALGESQAMQGQLSKPSETNVSRCVDLMTRCMGKSKTHDGHPHIMRSCMYNMTITINHRKVIRYDNARITAWPRSMNETEGTIIVHTHPMQTLHQLKTEVATKCHYHMADRIHFDHLTEDVDDSQKLCDLSFADGCEVGCYYAYSSTYAKNSHTTHTTGSANSSKIETAISEDSTRFNCLLKLCDCITNEVVLKKIWNLLMMVPTHKDTFEATTQLVSEYLDIIKSKGDPLATLATDWNAFIFGGARKGVSNDGSVSMTCYMLQLIDYILQPNQSYLEYNQKFNTISSLFKEYFISSKAYVNILSIVNQPDINVDGTLVEKQILSTALHILHYLLFASNGNKSDTAAAAEGDEIIEGSSEIIAALSSHSESLLLKLSKLAQQATVSKDSTVMTTALSVLNILLKTDSSLSAKLINTDAAKVIMVTALRNSSSKVRELCRSFSIKVGTDQPIVLEWLINEIQSIGDIGASNDTNSSSTAPSNAAPQEIFEAAGSLLALTDTNDQVSEFATFVSTQITRFMKEGSNSDANDRTVVSGYLYILTVLIKSHYQAFLATPVGPKLVENVLNKFLFTIPSANPNELDLDNDERPVCDTGLLRAKAFELLIAHASVSTVHNDTGSKNGDSALGTITKIIGSLVKGIEATTGKDSLGWNLQVTGDVKKKNISFTGLKNQGCTCYMNSLLQQLFMCTSFRKTIMNAPMLESMRTTLWHLSDEDLVSRDILISINGSWKRFHVRSYDAETGMHKLSHYNKNSTINLTSNIAVAESISSESAVEDLPSASVYPVTAVGDSSTDAAPAAEEVLSDTEIPLNLRKYKELNRIKLTRSALAMALSEQEQEAYLIFEQLQRTFAYMEYSKRRYYDPKPLVEACKSLNMEYNVYHQNDAAELFDKLLDRVETSTDGRHTDMNLHKMLIEEKVFGGTITIDKIYSETMSPDFPCGHDQGTRKEALNNGKVICQMRGFDNVHDSISQCFQSELMAGDNAIRCYHQDDLGCEEKFDLFRRTYIQDLPNTLVLHLKRFDLDYETFDTVKLNGRMEFPTKINMFKYTKDGLAEAARKEAAAAAAAAAAADGNDDSTGDDVGEDGNSSPVKGGGADGNSNNDEESPVNTSDALEGGNDEVEKVDESDYEYELRGVLVHSGVAHGGHYYSYACNPDKPDEWFKLDDDEVSPFDQTNIPYQCYGGVQDSQNSHIEIEKSNNALMVFYQKTIKNRVTGDENEDTKMDFPERAADRERLVTGYEAYKPEVMASNLFHTLSCYLMESDLHVFLMQLLETIVNIHDENESTLSNSTKDEVESTIQFCIRLFIDITLHSRDRDDYLVSKWVDAIKRAFETLPSTANWFVTTIMNEKECHWMSEFLQQCTDMKAKMVFLDVLKMAITAVAPEDASSLLSILGLEDEDNTGMVTIDVTNRVVAHLSGTEVVADPVMAQHTVIAGFILLLLEKVKGLCSSPRNCTDTFNLLSSVCAIPSIRKVLLKVRIISMLVWFLDPANPDIPRDIAEAFNTASESLVTSSTHKDIKGHGVSNVRSRNMGGATGMGLGHHSMSGALSEDPSLGQAYGNTPQADEYRMVWSHVFEVLTAIAGEPLIPRVPLMVDRIGSTWDQELTPDARQAFETIFYELCSTNSQGIHGMDEEACKAHFNKVGEKYKHKDTPLISRYPNCVSTDGRLMLKGFIKYYSDTGQHSENLLWNHLTCYGFKGDLTRDMTLTSQGSQGGDEEGALALEGAAMETLPVPVLESSTSLESNEAVGGSDDETELVAATASMSISDVHMLTRGSTLPAPSTPVTGTTMVTGKSSSKAVLARLDATTTDEKPMALEMSESCEKLIGNPNLYIIGMDVSDIATKSFVRCVCYDKLDLSLTLLGDALNRVWKATCEYQTMHRELSLSFVQSLLAINDIHRAARIEKVLMDEELGLITILLKEKEIGDGKGTECRASLYEPGAVKHRYLEHLAILCRDSAFYDVFKTRAAHDSVVHQMKRQLKLNNSYFSEEEEDWVKGATITMSGSGQNDVDGVYTFSHFFENAGCYMRRGLYTSKGVVKEEIYMIYKCVIKSGATQWFLSIVEEGSEPGSTKDIDFYFATSETRLSHIYGRILPPLKFNCFHQTRLHPAPTISITFPEGMEQPPIPVHSVTSNTRGGGHGGGSYNGHTGNVGLSHPNNAYYNNNNSNYPYDNLYPNVHEM